MHTYEPQDDMPLRMRIRYFRRIVGLAWQCMIRKNTSHNGYVFFRAWKDGDVGFIDYVQFGNAYAVMHGCRVLFTDAHDAINADIVLREAKQILNQAGERE